MSGTGRPGMSPPRSWSSWGSPGPARPPWAPCWQRHGRALRRGRRLPPAREHRQDDGRHPAGRRRPRAVARRHRRLGARTRRTRRGGQLLRAQARLPGPAPRGRPRTSSSSTSPATGRSSRSAWSSAGTTSCPPPARLAVRDAGAAAAGRAGGGRLRTGGPGTVTERALAALRGGRPLPAAPVGPPGTLPVPARSRRPRHAPPPSP